MSRPNSSTRIASARLADPPRSEQNQHNGPAARHLQRGSGVPPLVKSGISPSCQAARCRFPCSLPHASKHPTLRPCQCPLATPLHPVSRGWESGCLNSPNQHSEMSRFGREGEQWKRPHFRGPPLPVLSRRRSFPASPYPTQMAKVESFAYGCLRPLALQRQARHAKEHEHRARRFRRRIGPLRPRIATSKHDITTKKRITRFSLRLRIGIATILPR